MTQKPQILSVRTFAKGRRLSLESVELEFANGNFAVFERVVNQGAAVMVVPVTDQGIIMVHEYANGTDRYELGFVRGRTDEDETAEQAALRELQEEVGLGARELHYVRQMHPVPHYSNFQMDLFFARDCYPSHLEGDEIEPLRQSVWGFDELAGLQDHPEINDPRVLLALLMVEKWIKQ